MWPPGEIPEAFAFDRMSPQPFLSSSPKPFPTARSRYPALTRMLFNFHSWAKLDPSRTPQQRSFHRSQAKALGKRLATLQRQAWAWETLLKQAQVEYETEPQNLRPL